MPETLWDGGPLLEGANGVFPMGTDSILLANFASPLPCRRLLDLGTGSGILTILMSFYRPGLSADAIEIAPQAALLAEKNMELNGLSGSCSIISGDIRAHRQLLKAGAYDLTISNPPYFSSGSGPKASGQLESARSEEALTLDELCTAAAYATRWGGSFCLVYRPERLCELFICLSSHGLEPKRIRPVCHTVGTEAILFLIEARRGGKPGIKWEKPLILRNQDGSESAELMDIYHRKRKGASECPEN